MKHAYSHRFAAHKGFTLVESIIVLVVLGIAAVGIISLQSQIFSGQSGNKDIQVGVQLMQECAEKLLAKGRANYADTDLLTSAAATTSCNTITLPDYNAPTVPTLTAGNSGTTGMAACPFITGTNCKLIRVTQGDLTNGITFMLVRR